MKLKVLLPFIIATSLMLLSYTTSKVMYNPTCPTGYTGAPSFSSGSTSKCSSCHGGISTGMVTVMGLPSGSYVPGQTYTFSLTINHSAANRLVWGFAIKSISNVDRSVVGTFSTTNANASVKSSGNSLELSHATAATTAASISYTYSNLKWTAPATPTANQSNIRFYFTGVAGNGNGNDGTSDFTYNGTLDATYTNLPVVLSNFKLVNVRNNAVQVLWQTEQETAGETFEIESSIDAINWSSITTVLGKGSSTSQQYSYTNNQPLSSGNVNYYRIKMIEADGSYRYSATQSIKLSNKVIVVKPLGSSISFGLNQTISYSIQSDKNRTINVSIIDINGQILYNKQLNLMSGNNNVIIPNNALLNSRGMIFAQFNAEGFQETIKQIIF